MGENTSEAEMVPIETVDEKHTLAHRMIHYFYDRHATARDAWDIAFWQEFRRNHPNDSLDPKALRERFFNEIMQQPSHWRGLPYEMVQYLNPLFNRIRAEALEFRDLVPGVDYINIESAAETARVVANDDLPPLCLETMVLPSRATKRYISPRTEEIRSFLAAALSELVWVQDENVHKPTLALTECLSRIETLTENDIGLDICMEPGMQCYQSFHRNRTELQQSSRPAERPHHLSSGYASLKIEIPALTPSMACPAAFSTPLANPIAFSTPLAAGQDSASTPQAKANQHSSSLSLPIAASTPLAANPDLTPLSHPLASSTAIPTTSRPGAAAADTGILGSGSRTLKHVRSKPRKGVPK